jgi:putative FmdB family regulatory protein
MPIFEYQCEECGAVFERLTLHTSSAMQTITCPRCESTRTAKRFSTFSTSAGHTSSAGNAGASPFR